MVRSRPVTMASSCPITWGCCSSVYWEARGRNASVWRLFRFPSWLALEVLSLHTATPLGTRGSPWSAPLPTDQVLEAGMDPTMHTRT